VTTYTDVAQTQIENNLFHAGTVAISLPATPDTTQTVRVVSNTFALPSAATGVLLTNGALSLAIVNNLFLALAPTSAAFNAPALTQYSHNGYSLGTGLGTFAGDAYTDPAALEAVIPGANNIRVDPAPAAGVVSNLLGADNNPATHFDNNWSLFNGGASCDLRTGGTGGGPGDTAVDIVGATRTGAVGPADCSAGYSVGAYERD
jgi:hypothetical protein